jgi:hypothetical protein
MCYDHSSGLSCVDLNCLPILLLSVKCVFNFVLSVSSLTFPFISPSYGFLYSLDSVLVWSRSRELAYKVQIASWNLQTYSCGCWAEVSFEMSQLRRAWPDISTCCSTPAARQTAAKLHDVLAAWGVCEQNTSGLIELVSSSDVVTAFVWVWNFVSDSKEDHTRGVSENTVLREIFEPKREEMTGGRRKLRDI